MRINFPAAVPVSEFCLRFVQGMADRMAVSFCKYGLVADAYPSKVDAIESLKKRLDRYAETGNTEWLMDVANFAMIEFMHPRHPEAHYKPTDAKDSPGRAWSGGFSQQRNNHASESARQRLYGRNGD